MCHFGFIIPLRPKSESSDWNRDMALLNRTLQALLRQTYSGFTIYVVYTDAPLGMPEDGRINYVPFPFAFKPWEELPNKEDLLLKVKVKEKAARRWDKGRKVSYGSGLAKEAGCDYLMALDSDDLLSRHFLAYISSKASEASCAGWYMDKGYLYKDGSRSLVYVPRHMTGLNGSTHVLRSDLVAIPDFDSTEWGDYNLFTDHGWVRFRVKETYGATLEEIPQPMLVYVIHASNMSGVYQKEFGSHWKAIVKRIIRRRRLTKILREEFCIDSLPVLI
jgi:hypothetical protein